MVPRGAGLPARARLGRRVHVPEPARHLYVHVPFCAHRCGYCDFVTVTGRDGRHEAYVDALLADVERRGALGELAGDAVETVFVGGGTPTLLALPLLCRLLDGLPRAPERTVECNPETVTPALAAALAERGVRVSLGAQSFDAGVLATLERRAGPATVARAVTLLRGAGVANLSLDLLFGVPGQTGATLAADLDALIALAPDHCSSYELEAKPGTRFTHRHGAELERQAELLEDHYELVIARLEAAGYEWYETASFARPDRRGRHNLAYWLGRDYAAAGVGAVATHGLERRRNRPSLERYIGACLSGSDPPRETEELTAGIRQRERLMLGLRLAEGVELAAVADVVDGAEVGRLASLGLLRVDGGRLVLERRGRLLANEVIVRLLRD
jgi:oxygen-independent coproporphyrinogen-3 oxidase